MQVSYDACFFLQANANLVRILQDDEILAKNLFRILQDFTVMKTCSKTGKKRKRKTRNKEMSEVGAILKVQKAHGCNNMEKSQGLK